MLSWLTYIGFRIEVWVRFRKVRNVLIGKRKNGLVVKRTLTKGKKKEKSQSFLSTFIKKF